MAYWTKTREKNNMYNKGSEVRHTQEQFATYCIIMDNTNIHPGLPWGKDSIAE